MVLTVLSKRVTTWIIDSVQAVARIFGKLRRGKPEGGLSQALIPDGARGEADARFTSPDRSGELFLQDLVRLEKHFATRNIRVQYRVQCTWPHAD